MNVTQARLAGVAALAVLISYMLPWTLGGLSVFKGVWLALKDGYFASGFFPVFEFLRFIAILGFACLVVFRGLLRASCRWPIVAALGSLIVADTLILMIQYVGFGGASLMSFFQGFGLGQALNYISAFGLIAVSVWGARTQADVSLAPDHSVGVVTPAIGSSPTDFIPGVAAILLLTSFLMPWASVRGVSTTLADVGSQIFRIGNFNRAPPELIVAVLTFVVAIILAAVVAYQAFVTKRASRSLVLTLGLIGLLIFVVAGFRLSGAVEQFRGMVDLSRIFDVLGIGAYIFFACSAWLVWIGAVNPPRPSE